MKVNFTKENLARLEQLFVQLGFANEGIEAKFGAKMVSPLDALHFLSRSSLEDLLVQVQTAVQKYSKINKWTTVNEQVVKDQLKFQTWAEFLDLTIGWKYWKESLETENRTIQQKFKELEKLTDSVKTPEQRINELQDELRSLGAFPALPEKKVVA